MSIYRCDVKLIFLNVLEVMGIGAYYKNGNQLR